MPQKSYVATSMPWATLMLDRLHLFTEVLIEFALRSHLHSTQSEQTWSKSHQISKCLYAALSDACRYCSRQNIHSTLVWDFKKRPLVTFSNICFIAKTEATGFAVLFKQEIQ